MRTTTVDEDETLPSHKSQNRLSAFFEKAGTKFGVFYPSEHLLAVFARLEDAISANEALIRAGWQEDDTIAVAGEEVVAFAENKLLKDGLWGVMMHELSLTIGTEAAYADNDLGSAKKGMAFVLVHCAGEKSKTRAWESLKINRPLSARYYSLGGIEHLAGEV